MKESPFPSERPNHPTDGSNGRQPDKHRHWPRLVWAWWRHLMRFWWLGLVALIAVAAAYMVHTAKEHPPVQLAVKHDTRIDVSAEEVRSIRDIGQWEFLSVSTEELVEWSRRRTFGTDRLVRIYTGTLRLGVDLTKASDDWFTSLPDSVARLRLPPIGLLDDNFIDEARTRSFYEKGICPPEARNQLYAQARKLMMQRCLTPQNLKTAEDNARVQFTKTFEAMGFKKVDIEFAPATQARQ